MIDDDALTRKILIRTLTAAGYQCGESESGKAAWERVHREQPALLLICEELLENVIEGLVVYEFGIVVAVDCLQVSNDFAFDVFRQSFAANLS